MYSLIVENIKCIIAAGGLGTRLQDFRGNKSTKILLDVNGISMINRQISQLYDISVAISSPPEILHTL